MRVPTAFSLKMSPGCTLTYYQKPLKEQVLRLAFRPLLGLAGFDKPRLLALFGARVALEELRRFEHLARVRLRFDDGARDGMTESVGLTRDAAARDMGDDGVVLGALGLRERLFGRFRAFVCFKIVLHALTIDRNA